MHSRPLGQACHLHTHYINNTLHNSFAEQEKTSNKDSLHDMWQWQVRNVNIFIGLKIYVYMSVGISQKGQKVTMAQHSTFRRACCATCIAESVTVFWSGLNMIVVDVG